MPSSFIDTVGILGAAVSMTCWLPQVSKVLRERETRAISLASTIAIMTSSLLWLTYGIARADWPLTGSSLVSLASMLIIVTLKLRWG